MPVLLSALVVSAASHALTDDEISKLQTETRALPLGERIAFWAERFVGVPYDPDPLGQYVSRAAIVADDRADCMYLTFRAVELALSASPEEAVQKALDKRFRSKGLLSEGKVINYDDRFQYGEDMLLSGKWGREITNRIGSTVRIRGSRGLGPVTMIRPSEMRKGIQLLKSGDLVFFVKKPGLRASGEIVGHIGIVKIEPQVEAETGQGTGEDKAVYNRYNTNTPAGLKTGRSSSVSVYLIHAGGVKSKGGVVKKVLLKDYILRMPFAGAKITRFD